MRVKLYNLLVPFERVTKKMHEVVQRIAKLVIKIVAAHDIKGARLEDQLIEYVDIKKGAGKWVDPIARII